MAKKTFRLIVCFDIDADSLEEAYAKLRPAVEQAGFPWETSDEWYDHDNESGEPGDPAELQRAVLACLKKGA